MTPLPVSIAAAIAAVICRSAESVSPSLAYSNAASAANWATVA